MAQTDASKSAATGTEEKNTTTHDTGCPTWNRLGAGVELLPFFRPNEEMKRQGFDVTFLGNEPRKETDSTYTDAKELWFDVEQDGKVQTWTVSQLSLLMELKKHAPLAGKCFSIKLVPVDADFRKKRPTYKGKDRYEVKLVLAPAKVVHATAKAGSAQAEEVMVEDA